MKVNKFIVGIFLLTAMAMQAEQWNCPKRVVTGDIRTQEVVQTRMISTAEMATTTIGTLSLPPRVPVILVNFSDYTFSTTKAHADSIFNATTPIVTDLGIVYEHMKLSHGSVAKYFKDQSLGKYVPTFDIIGPVTLSKGYGYYGQGFHQSAHAGEMIQEACTLVNDSVDFSQYDSNKDGTIDLVFVLFAGFGEHDRDYIDSGFGVVVDNLVWPHYSTTSGGRFDGKNLGPYECCNELDGFLSKPSFLVPAGSGILVHEYSHGIGLPDVYVGNTQYMGWWDLMDYGCYNMETFVPAAYNGYQRWFCGWSEPKMMNTAKNDTLRPITSSGDFGVIAASGTVTGPHNNDTEYWIVENHQKEKGSWDEYAKGKGLILYHMCHHNKWTSGANSNTAQDGCLLLPADGILRVSGAVGRQENCYPYQGKDSIKVAANYPITAITQETNGNITLKVCGGEKPARLGEMDEKAKWLNGEKILFNGMLYIRRGDKLYTITGNETHIL